MEPAAPRLAKAREMLARGDFTRARELYQAECEQDPSAEALDGLGQALWFTGHIEAGIAYRQQAFARFRRSGDVARAAEIALWLVVEQATSIGNVAAANGWFQRAERLLADAPRCAAHAQLEVARGHRCADPAEAQRHFERAAEIGRQLGQPDYEILGLAALGNLKVEFGDLAGGMALLDETMAAAMSGEVADPWVVGSTCCSSLFACERISDLRRAVEWCEAFIDFTTRRRLVPLSALCRAVYGRVLTAQGQWQAAEAELHAALRGFRGRRKPLAGYALARFAELRIRQGRIEEARELLRGWEEHPEARPTVIRLLAASGETKVAIAKLEHELDWLGRDTPRAAALLPTLVGLRLDDGDVAAARTAAWALTTVAARLGYLDLMGAAHLAAGRVAAAAGEAGARSQLQDAVDGYARVGMPYEQALAQLELARVVHRDSAELAVAEARSAFVAFERLGAAHDADRAAALLRSFGVRGRGAPKRPGELTRREQEVLTLLELGLSNKQIATRLYISSKTAGHHVSRILSKLELHSRAEAAAHAARRRAEGGSPNRESAR